MTEIEIELAGATSVSISSVGPARVHEGPDVHDVLIIGSGAGGAPLATVLSEAGLKVLMLEKGPRHARSDYLHDEVLRSFGGLELKPKLADDPHVLLRAELERPQLTNLGWIGSCVGGGTVRMGGYFYRFHPDDFRMATRFGEFEELADWPYDYDDLEPYYCRAEWEVGVSGGYSPFDGRRSRPLPMPPVDCHPLASILEDACKNLGWHAFPTPRAVNSRAFKGRPACSYCSFCGGYGCPTGARGSTQETLLPRAEATGRCQILTRATVKEVTIDAGGSVRGCVYLDSENREHEARARVVCISCSAVESARLLLTSRSSQFPDGLANGNGLVGRHLQFHAGSRGSCRFHSDQLPSIDLLDPNPYLGFSIMDHYFLPEGVSPLAKGGILRFGMTSPEPISRAQQIAFKGSDSLLWGESLKRALHDRFHYSREVHFEVFHDFIPNARTRIELDPKVRDRQGLPVARIYLDEPEHHKLAGRWLAECGKDIFDAMGAKDVELGSTGHTTRVHAHGTCRAGKDPATSVLDPFCRAHEVPNLFVVDGSFMPTSAGATPTLTILANSFRTADHIVERFRAGDF